MSAKFKHLGFFIEHQVGSKLVGTTLVDENQSGLIGWESTETHIAKEDILLQRGKKIKKGQTYKTRIYPLCGKVIKN